jgi:hypothetical protein
MDEPDLEAADAPEDEETPVALVMVEADGADACAVDGTCW